MLRGEFHSPWAQQLRAVGDTADGIVGLIFGIRKSPVVVSFCSNMLLLLEGSIQENGNFCTKNPELCLTLVLQKSQ